jgi:hypothetical protein
MPGNLLLIESVKPAEKLALILDQFGFEAKNRGILQATPLSDEPHDHLSAKHGPWHR